jgi:acetyl-CoA C-acetyltransferase
MEEAYIVSATRSPIGRFGGGLVDFSPVDLAAHVMKAAVEQAGIEGKDLDLYVFGNILKHGHGQLLPRNAAIKAGIPPQVDGYAIDMLCSSGMMSVMNGATAIRMGEADLVLAGGVESMSQAGFYLSHRARWGYKFLMGAPEQLVDLLLLDGLTDSTTGEGMGEETERLAADQGVTRAELDEVAYLSHSRADEATQAGWFKQEITPVEIKKRKGTELLDQDEGIRPDTTMDSLMALRPAFKKDGVLTAGNSSQISDGGAALVLASAKAVKEHGLKPRARILGWALSAGEPWRFVEAPIPAIHKLLDKLDMSIEDFDLFENNEAFALNNVLFRRELEVPYDKINIYGGAIALGHPIGCSGARILVTLLNALEQRDGRRGMASLCHGTGGSTVVAIERV